MRPTTDLRIADPMDNTHVFDTLNELLAAEQASLLPRLTECTVYVSPVEISGFEGVRRMTAEHQAHTSRLAQTLIELGGQPQPNVKDINTANFHYVNLDVLLPQVVADEQALTTKYEGAQAELADCAPAAAVAGDLASWHRVCAEYLRTLVDDAVRPA